MPRDPAVTVHVVCDDVVPVLEPGGVEEGGDRRKRRVEDVVPPEPRGRDEEPFMPPDVPGSEVEILQDELARPEVLGPVDQPLRLRRDPHRVDRGSEDEDVGGGNFLEDRRQVVPENADPRPVAGVASPARGVVERPEDDLLHVGPRLAGALKNGVEQGLGVPVPPGAAGESEDRYGLAHATPASRRCPTTSPARARASDFAVG